MAANFDSPPAPPALLGNKAPWNYVKPVLGFLRAPFNYYNNMYRALYPKTKLPEAERHLGSTSSTPLRLRKRNCQRWLTDMTSPEVCCLQGLITMEFERRILEPENWPIPQRAGSRDIGDVLRSFPKANLLALKQAVENELWYRDYAVAGCARKVRVQVQGKWRNETVMSSDMLDISQICA